MLSTYEIILMPAKHINLTKLLSQAQIRQDTAVEVIIMKNQITIIKEKEK